MRGSPSGSTGSGGSGGSPRHHDGGPTLLGWQGAGQSPTLSSAESFSPYGSRAAQPQSGAQCPPGDPSPRPGVRGAALTQHQPIPASGLRLNGKQRILSLCVRIYIKGG